MGFALKQEVTLETEECCNCGTLFAMPAILYRRARADAEVWFYCPNGHKQHYTETEVQRLRAKLDEQTRVATSALERARRAEEGEQKAVDEAKRLKKRVQAGVCTCCNRTFQNLARHMKTKHPEAK
jgi:hypothetical protein